MTLKMISVPKKSMPRGYPCEVCHRTLKYGQLALFIKKPKMILVYHKSCIDALPVEEYFGTTDVLMEEFYRTKEELRKGNVLA